MATTGSKFFASVAIALTLYLSETGCATMVNLTGQESSSPCFGQTYKLTCTHPVLDGDIRLEWERNGTRFNPQSTPNHDDEGGNTPTTTTLTITVTREEFENKVYTYRCFTFDVTRGTSDPNRVISNGVTVDPPVFYLNFTNHCNLSKCNLSMTLDPERCCKNLSFHINLKTCLANGTASEETYLSEESSNSYFIWNQTYLNYLIVVIAYCMYPVNWNATKTKYLYNNELKDSETCMAADLALGDDNSQSVGENGYIGGIVVGAILFVICLFILLIGMLIKKHRRKMKPSHCGGVTVDTLSNPAAQVSKDPAIEVNKDADTLSNPAIEVNKDADSLSNPAIEVNKDADTLSNPAIEVNKDADSLSNPAIKVNKDADSLSNPAIEVNKDADSLSNPAIEVNKDADSLSNPAIEVNKDADSLSNPAIEVNKDADSLSNPAIEVNKDADSLSNPAIEVNKDADSLSNPAIEVNKDADSLSNPAIEVNKDADSLSNPAIEVNKDADSLSNPAIEVNKDADSLSNPAIEVNKDADSLSNPAIEVNKDADSLSNPAIEVNKDAGTLSNPAIEVNKDADSLSNPAIEVNKDADSLSNPAIEVNKDADSLSNPAIEVNKDADSLSNPAIEVNKDADTLSNPAIEVNKDADTLSNPVTKAPYGSKETQSSSPDSKLIASDKCLPDYLKPDVQRSMMQDQGQVQTPYEETSGRSNANYCTTAVSPQPEAIEIAKPSADGKSSTLHSSGNPLKPNEGPGHSNDPISLECQSNSQNKDERVCGRSPEKVVDDVPTNPVPETQ